MAENERMVKEMEAKWEEKLEAAEKENKVQFPLSCFIALIITEPMICVSKKVHANSRFKCSS